MGGRTSSSLESSKKVEVPVSPTSPKLKFGMLSDPLIHSTGGDTWIKSENPRSSQVWTKSAKNDLDIPVLATRAV